jgi:hypothetical protein
LLLLVVVVAVIHPSMTVEEVLVDIGQMFLVLLLVVVVVQKQHFRYQLLLVLILLRLVQAESHPMVLLLFLVLSLRLVGVGAVRVQVVVAVVALAAVADMIMEQGRLVEQELQIKVLMGAMDITPPATGRLAAAVVQVEQAELVLMPLVALAVMVSVHPLMGHL